MSERPQRMPALPALGPTTTSQSSKIAFFERPFLGYLNLRGNPRDPAFLDSVQSRLGVPLPLQPDTVSANNRCTVLWLGPDEWLLVTEPSQEDALVPTLSSTLQGCFFSLTNVTDGQTMIRLTGTRAVDVLRKGCSLDLHPHAFGPGRCAQTLLAKTGILIHCLDPLPSFDLIVRRSFAGYLALWLQDAATEYGG